MSSTSEPHTRSDAKTGTLKSVLNAALPKGFHCKARYIRTPAKTCDPLFSPPPGHEPEKTRLESHFLTASIESHGQTKDVLALGFEVLVYSTKHLTTIFVSKADSTGYLPQQQPSPVKQITTTFLQWLSTKERQRHPTRTVVVSLFARAQSQYLFPGSAENPKKHVLDDRQLIKWWTRVLDPLFLAREETQEAEYNGYITVPGYESREILQFLPLHNQSSGAVQHWNPANPLKELASTRGIPTDAPPRCLLPRFPDDPKARFMQDLDDEVGISNEPSTTTSPSRRKNGNWSSVRDLDRFWEAMEFRQECSSGRVVGFLWLVTRKKHEVKGQSEVKNDGNSQASLVGRLSSDPAPQEEEPATDETYRQKRRKPLSGPIIPRQPRLKSNSSSLTSTSDLASTLSAEIEDGLVLSRDCYDRAMHTLLHLDFANAEVAAQSTSKWVTGVSSICGIQTDWMLQIEGQGEVKEASKSSGGNDGQINDLGGMVRKKKRKPDEQIAVEDRPTIEAEMQTTTVNVPAVNVLGGGMVRKKPKSAVA